MSVYKPGGSYAVEFVTSSDTGAAADADALPVATVNKNGTDDGSSPTGWGNTLTVAKIDTGRYKVTGTIDAGYSAGDIINVSVAATIGGIAAKCIIDNFNIVTKYVSDLNDIAAGAEMDLVDAPNGTAVAAIQDGLATSGAQTTAQNDLDTITGADGVTLATLQGNYAPSKAGDSMDLVADAVNSSSLATSALAKFVDTDTGEVAAEDGSVAKISQGAAGGNVTVGSMTQTALAQFVDTDTGETEAVEGSVVSLVSGGESQSMINGIAGSKLYIWLESNSVYIDIWSMTLFEMKEDCINIMLDNSKLYTIELNSPTHVRLIASLSFMAQLLPTDTLPGLILWGGSNGYSNSEMNKLLEDIIDART